MSDRPALDIAEGLGWGYQQVQLEVQTETGTVLAWSYQVTNIDHGTRPYDLYKALVVADAHEHRLADDYVSALQAVPTVAGWSGQRAAENLCALGTG